MVYRQHLVKKSELDEKRFAFCLQLGAIVLKHRPLIYLDQASTNAFMFLKKSWALANFPNEIPVNSGARVSCTMFGAIGSCLRSPCISIERSTNKEAMLRFLMKIKSQLKDNTVKPFIVLDGA